MATRFDNAADFLSRSTDMPSANPMSVCFKLYIDVDRNAQGSLFQILNSGGTQRQGVLLNTDGTTLIVSTQNGSTTGTNLSVGTWYDIGYSRNGSTHRAYVNGVLDITRTDNNTLTVASMVMGSNTVSFLNGRVQDVKLWNGVELAEAEFNLERFSRIPYRLANLYAYWPMMAGERTVDYSGNGRNWTENGALADNADVEVAWGHILSTNKGFW